MYEVGAQDRDVGLETCQDRLADAKRLHGFLICAREQMFIMRCRCSEDIAKPMRKSELHGFDPF
jgi:hypothetical protein